MLLFGKYKTRITSSAPRDTRPLSLADHFACRNSFGEEIAASRNNSCRALVGSGDCGILGRRDQLGYRAFAGPRRCVPRHRADQIATPRIYVIRPPRTIGGGAPRYPENAFVVTEVRPGAKAYNRPMRFWIISVLYVFVFIALTWGYFPQMLTPARPQLDALDGSGIVIVSAVKRKAASLWRREVPSSAYPDARTHHRNQAHTFVARSNGPDL